MGLDMYLIGEKHTVYPTKRKEDNFPLSSINIELGYWRKHPDLHGFIVKTFAQGRDDCQRIPLNEDDLFKIVNAINLKRLPETTGPFFGESEDSAEEAKTDIAIFEKAIRWLKRKEEGFWKCIYYQASW